MSHAEFLRRVTLKEEMVEALKKDYSYCDYTFSNLRISGSTTEATVLVDSVEACKPKIAKPAQPLAGRQQFRLVKNPAGAWSLADIFVQ